LYFFTPKTVGSRPVINTGANYFNNIYSKPTKIPHIVKSNDDKQHKYPVNNQNEENE
jgi:hypothetical protein